MKKTDYKDLYVKLEIRNEFKPVHLNIEKLVKVGTCQSMAQNLKFMRQMAEGKCTKEMRLLKVFLGAM